jgi:hypothetical protein
MRKLIVILFLLAQSCLAGIWVTPEYAGNSETDSVIISFCVFDTTLYPVLSDADSIVALRLGPDNAMLDSLDQSSAQMHHLRTGWYEVHFRAANSQGDLGVYRTFIRAYVGGGWRGAAVVSYEVIAEGLGDYLTHLVAQNDSIQDTLGQVLQLMPQLGGGAYPCSVYVFDQSTQTAIPEAMLTLFNSDQTTVIASGRTDGNGRVVLALDAGSFVAYVRALNFIADPAATVISVTAGGANDTLWLQRFDPGAPVAANLCRVYGYVQDLHGRPLAEVVVKATISEKSLTSDGAVISPYTESATTDTLGYWYLDLIPNQLLEPDTTKYDFSIYYPSGTILRRAIAIPDSGSYRLE